MNSKGFLRLVAVCSFMALAWPVHARPAQIPPSVLPGLGSIDPRRLVDATGTPWRALGRVQTELGSRCTGVLVGPRTVVTAAHCLVSYRTRRFVQPTSVHFLLGYDRGTYAGHARIVHFTVPPGFDPATSQPAGADWARLTLDAPLGAPDRVIPLARRPVEIGATVTLAGYEQDRDEVLLADFDCHVGGLLRDRAGNPVLRDGCAATRGASGAPLLARASDGSWEVVGIQTRALIDEAGGFAVPASTLDQAGSKQ
jgi:protease YdgD